MVKRKKVKPGEAFHFHNGMTAETKSQLLVQLKQMSEEEFSSYVNERKNSYLSFIKRERVVFF